MASKKLSKKQADLLIQFDGMPQQRLEIGWINGNTKGYVRRMSRNTTVVVPQATAASLIANGWMYEDEAQEWKISQEGKAALEAYKASK